ncbi:unnamed protein product [Orchesella dallaii]|uniref:Uncharacterized protein n=1 Tax=Orchesella dallaii TaxID=48710 RepID=A0ABP1PX54_9HEXA
MVDLKKFAVVHFLRENSVEAVPRSWISSNQLTCAYPRKFPQNFESLRSNEESVPPAQWGRYKVKILKSYDSLEKANRKANKFLVTSDVETTDCDNPNTSAILTLASSPPTDSVILPPPPASSIFTGINLGR